MTLILNNASVLWCAKKSRMRVLMLHKKKSNSLIIWRRVYVWNEGVIIEFNFLFAGRNEPVTGNIEQQKQG